MFSSRFRSAPSRQKNAPKQLSQLPRLVIAPTLNPTSQALPLNSESASICPTPSTTKAVPSSHFSPPGTSPLELPAPTPSSTGDHDPEPVIVLPNPSGPLSLTRRRHPRSRPLREALRKSCILSSRTPDLGRASPPRCPDLERCAEAAFPSPLPRQHACVRPGDIGGEEADAVF